MGSKQNQDADMMDGFDEQIALFTTMTAEKRDKTEECDYLHSDEHVPTVFGC